MAMESDLERRIDALEAAMAELARESAKTRRDWRRHRAEMRSLSVERLRSEEAYRREMDRRDAEARAADEVFWRELRLASGELSRRLGTLAEDLVAPGVGRILRTVIGAEEDEITCTAVGVVRRSPRRPGQTMELDVVAECRDVVLMNEAKSRLRPEHVAVFVERLGQAREFFPEYAQRRILGAIASLYVDESVVRLGERHGLIVLGFGEDLMDVLNSPGFAPREF